MAKKAVEKEFVKIVRKKLNNRLKKIMLFGSYARGDYTEHSDYDILVVVDKREKFVQDVILDACVEIMDKYYELIGCIVCDEKEWELKKKFPIGLNILKEGIEL
ncbi:MAG: nucleotidyltransferase domain-containing protein [Candidatus Aminicenantes bacterium]|nr:nucleotidyltransferase domain-containing protein [Candidatus Aminicenantes bacterium]NIM82393.1 nucleotidyltransferase domain-containing protein [Candidatus Aminicenantes bacterium]NIN24230.1 nucleotidyltransferase domain-containing protein [Candidatus Aminicenantes bacterium]NIN47957.1 nucleotidyltransferase domain-containing protein [Candidatus Aminicenantes bacterium]NIN90893.1 nucleotidyltransferase domain-containing protein [Candidatus Aminicenantes bacterium]